MVHNMLSILLQFLARLNTSAYCASQNILPGTYFVAFCFLGLWWSNETNSYEVHLSLWVELVICVKSCLLLRKEGATPWVAKNARNEISLSDEIVFSKLSMHFLYFRLWQDIGMSYYEWDILYEDLCWPGVFTDNWDVEELHRFI